MKANYRIKAVLTVNEVIVDILFSSSIGNSMVYPTDEAEGVCQCLLEEHSEQIDGLRHFAELPEAGCSVGFRAPVC